MDYKNYKYEFDVDNCCWKSVCGLKDTPKCCSACVRYMKMQYLLGNSLLPKSWWMPKRFETDETNPDYEAHKRCIEIKNNIQQFVKEGKQLLIYSAMTGVGKTHMAIRLLLTYLAEIWESTSFRPRAMFIQVDKLFTEQKMGYGGKSDYFEFIMANYESVDLIVWDDIATENMTDAQYSLLFTMINDRVFGSKANIFTTNKTPEELYNILGDRLYSRMVAGAEHIHFVGSGDKRFVG